MTISSCLHSNPMRFAALGAAMLFAGCSGTSNVASALATHAPIGEMPPQQVVIANTSDEAISPLVHAAPCWIIDPPFPQVPAGKDSQPVKLDAQCADSEMSVDYDGSGDYCTLDVRYLHIGQGGAYTYAVEQGFATKCTASTTASGARFTYALK